MANCHEQFVRYQKNLEVPDTTFNRLLTAKDSIEKQLRKYFRNREGYTVKGFKVQGSKSIGTMIRKKGDTVDIDFGIYFYPKPEVKPATLIENVYKALYEVRTTYPPTRKTKCVRVQYNEKSRIHMDIPVFYYERLKGDRDPHMATRSKYIRSDTTEFEKWFKDRGKRNPQLRRIIRYLKGWATNQKCDMPKGVALTVLAATHQARDKREDVAFLGTLKEIRRTLKKRFYCEMPAEPRDDLLLKMKSELKQKAFFERLDAIIKDGEKAVSATRKSQAAELWQKHLGKHFTTY